MAWPQRQPMAQDELAGRLRQAEVVIVGEVHPHPEHHRIQQKILEIMAGQGGSLSVGIEWLDHQSQPACDRLSAGEITVEEFARQANWAKKWGYPLDLYLPILQRVRDGRLRLIALNAPAAVVQKLARQGLKSLDPDERAQLAPALDLNDAPYARQIESQFKGHGLKGPAAQKNFLAAQIARDETMAHYLAQGLEPWPDGGKRAVVFAGAGHMSHGLGLLPRLKRRLPGAALLTVLPVSPEEAEALWQDASGAPPADLLVIASAAAARPSRLGLTFSPVAEGLKVTQVAPQGPAARAGIRAGDILAGIDGERIRQVKDIHRALKAAPFAPHRFHLKRGEEDLLLTVTLPEPGK